VKFLKNKFLLFFAKLGGRCKYAYIKLLGNSRYAKINLCSGTMLLEGYCNIDLCVGSDLVLDLEKTLLPFPDNSINVVVCISSINYFSRERAKKIISDVYRVLKVGGVARFGTQDLRRIAEKYVNNDVEFFFQKLPNGEDRFVGQTMADKINSWFYGYEVAKNKGCKYVYDYVTLESLFREAGFSVIENKKYQESVIPNISEIDNRPDQMFFLEAVR
jgi:predicted SAM-dependent methyltransferase